MLLLRQLQCIKEEKVTDFALAHFSAYTSGLPDKEKLKRDRP